MRATAVLLLLATAAGGCSRRVEPAATPPPPAPPPSPSQPPRPFPPASVEMRLRICVIAGGSLTEVDLHYDPVTGDSTYQGRPVSLAFPVTADYAASHPWYADGEPIRFRGRRFVRYGEPRVLGVPEVARAGEYRGVGVYTEPGDTAPAFVYLPVRPGCEFQPYQLERKTGAPAADRPALPRPPRAAPAAAGRTRREA